MCPRLQRKDNVAHPSTLYFGLFYAIAGRNTLKPAGARTEALTHALTVQGSVTSSLTPPQTHRRPAPLPATRRILDSHI